MGGDLVRWLVVQPGPDFSVHDVYNGWTEALRELGEHVQEFDLRHRLTFYDSVAIETGRDDGAGYREFRKAVTHEQAIELAAQAIYGAAYRFWPDCILIVSAFFVPADMIAILRSRGHKVVLLLTECPYEDPRQLPLAAQADVTLVNDPGTIGAYRDACPAVAYAPHAYRPKIHFPRQMTREYDLVFSGTGYTSRVEFFRRMRLRGLSVGLAGNWVALPKRSALRKYLVHDDQDCLDNEMTAELYGTGRAGINFYRREAEQGATADGWAMGPREVEQSACNLFFLRDPRPEGDHVLSMLPTFDGPEDAGEKLRWWLRHNTQREAAAQAAREAVLGRTFTSNAEMLLRLLDRKPVTI